MKKFYKVSLIILVIILIVSSIILLLKVYDVYESTITKTFDSYLIVSDSGGVGLVPGVVFFGKMRPGDRSTAIINTNSTFDYPMYFSARAEGQIKQFFVNNNFILQPYENKSVYLSVIIPKNTTFGRYEGRVIISLRKALF